jgi:hypothetical protein
MGLRGCGTCSGFNCGDPGLTVWVSGDAAWYLAEDEDACGQGDKVGVVGFV